jgi:micrococcal nuclease
MMGPHYRLIFLLLAAAAAIWLAWDRRGGTQDASYVLPLAATQRPANLPLGKVTRVIDGDTIDVQYLDGTTKRVRLLGIDTPETNRPGASADCFSSNATQFTRQRLLGRTVGLESDPSQDDVDRYGRQLRYIWLDNLLINYVLVREGYAREYTFRTPHRYRPLFLEAQSQAKTTPAGMWRHCPTLAV